MTAKETARKIFHNLYSIDSHKNSVKIRAEKAKQTAELRICSKLSSLHEEYNKCATIMDEEKRMKKEKMIARDIEYWQQVKQEINSL